MTALSALSAHVQLLHDDCSFYIVCAPHCTVAARLTVKNSRASYHERHLLTGQCRCVAHTRNDIFDPCARAPADHDSVVVCHVLCVDVSVILRCNAVC